MSKRWSKLQRDFYKLRVSGLNLQIHCRLYRMKSQRGSNDIPRYWVTLNGEIIWDYPKQFIHDERPERGPKWYPHVTDVPDISDLIREYINTPGSEVMTKKFEGDHWGLVDILRASDRRVGCRRWQELKQASEQSAAYKIIVARS